LTSGPTLQTERLVLRRWRYDDVAQLAVFNADPDVMRFYVSTNTLEQTANLVERFEDHFEEHGFGIWALEARQGGPLLGFTGLTNVPIEADFTPAVEIAWRLGKEHWGNGYATEAARASLAFGFAELGLEEIVAMAVPANIASLAVMERIGMIRDLEGDFDNPMIPDGPLRRFVLYRISRSGTGEP
jgi:RimJ/RimL family protein N-acetyltransferase